MPSINKSITVFGIKEIDKALASIEPKLQRKVIRKAMRSGMKDIQADIVSRFPKDTGETAKTIKVRAGKGKRGEIVIDVKSQDDNFIPKFLEFGTVNEDGSVRMPARPSFRPAFDEGGEAARLKTQKQILEGIKDITNK